MEELPFVDEHARTVTASRTRTWQALLAVLARAVDRVPTALALAWGLQPATAHGDWSVPEVGATIAGFGVVEAEPPRQLTLRGRHRFSRYELRFATGSPVSSSCERGPRPSSRAWPAGPTGRW